MPRLWDVILPYVEKRQTNPNKWERNKLSSNVPNRRLSFVPIYSILYNVMFVILVANIPLFFLVPSFTSIPHARYSLTWTFPRTFVSPFFFPINLTSRCTGDKTVAWYVPNECSYKPIKSQSHVRIHRRCILKFVITHAIVYERAHKPIINTSGFCTRAFNHFLLRFQSSPRWTPGCKITRATREQQFKSRHTSYRIKVPIFKNGRSTFAFTQNSRSSILRYEINTTEFMTE